MLARCCIVCSINIISSRISDFFQEINYKINIELANAENEKYHSVSSVSIGTINDQEPLHDNHVLPSLSVNVSGQTRHVPPSHTVSCNNAIHLNELMLQESVFVKRTEVTTRGFDNLGSEATSGSSNDSSSDDDDDDNDDSNNQDNNKIHSSLLPHHHRSNPQYSIENKYPKYDSLSTTVNSSVTPEETAGKLREAITTQPSISVGIVPPRPPALCIKKGDNLIDDNLKERDQFY